MLRFFFSGGVAAEDDILQLKFGLQWREHPITEHFRSWNPLTFLSPRECRCRDVTEKRNLHSIRFQLQRNTHKIFMP